MAKKKDILSTKYLPYFKHKDLKIMKSTKRLRIIRQGMTQRCYNEKHIGYSNYGGKGIKICEEWRHSSNDFIRWALENGYDENLTIDRIDSNKSYSPCNCRWVSKSIQSRNRIKAQKNNSTGKKGVFKDKKYFRAMIRIDGKLKHIGSYPNVEDAGKAYNNYIISNKLEHTLNF